MTSAKCLPPSLPRRQRGAALLMAMAIVTLVTTVAAWMVWQQWRAVQVESAERALTQSHWILRGALDWARLILREDGRSGGDKVDHLGEPWAVELAEARLSSFLSLGITFVDASGSVPFVLSGNVALEQITLDLRMFPSLRNHTADSESYGVLNSQFLSESSPCKRSSPFE